MRLIDADTLLKKVEKILPWAPYPSAYAQGIRYCMELMTVLIKDAPTIEPERKKGKWIEEPNCYYRCSRCSSHYPSILGYMDYKYCPNCGADMREEQNE